MVALGFGVLCYGSLAKPVHRLLSACIKRRTDRRCVVLTAPAHHALPLCRGLYRGCFMVNGHSNLMRRLLTRAHFMDEEVDTARLGNSSNVTLVEPGPPLWQFGATGFAARPQRLHGSCPTPVPLANSLGTRKRSPEGHAALRGLTLELSGCEQQSWECQRSRPRASPSCPAAGDCLVPCPRCQLEGTGERAASVESLPVEPSPWGWGAARELRFWSACHHPAP